MKPGMTFEYLKCRADLNFEVDYGVNHAIGAIVTKWILFYPDKGSFSSIIFFNTLQVPLNRTDMNMSAHHCPMKYKLLKKIRFRVFAPTTTTLLCHAIKVWLNRMDA